MGFGGLYISISGLQASKTSLDTVSHNISNSNNIHYVRQAAMHTNNSYITSAGGFQVGTGVNVNQIRQIRDEFLDLKMRRESASFGYHYAKSVILEDVEAVFNEITNSGLQNVMKDMWNNWNELYKDPDSLTIRGLVHESTVAFTDTVNHISKQLNDIKQNLNKEITNKVSETNSILNQIAAINQQIKVVEGENTKVKANDYRDERNALIDRLSELLPITSYENKFGETVISLHGKDLVNGTYVSNIDLKNNSEGLGMIYWDKTNEIIDLKGKGELGGYIDARDESLNNYMGRLDSMVTSLADKINELHRGGIGLGETTAGGLDFFVGQNGKITAGNIKINSELSNYNKIAISTTGKHGEGNIALEIYNLRNSTELDGLDGMNLDDYYKNIILEIGLEREESRNISDNQGFLIKSLDERRKSLSAVSLDEEMTDMVKFQHSYTANSRVINAIDEMIDTVVNRVGLVGR